MVISIRTTDNSTTHFENEFSTKPIDIFLRLFKKLPEFWSAKIGVKKIIESFPIYKEYLQIPNSDEIYSWIEEICQTPHRRPGTPEGLKAEEWVFQKLKELGVKNVTKEPIPIDVWNAEEWSLNVKGKIIPSFFCVNTGFTSAQGITAPLVYVGKGRYKDFKKVDVSGKIVVGEVTFPFIPIGILFNFLKILRGVYHISDPDGSFSLFKTQYLNFVRQNFIGGTTSENAPHNDVYWNSFKGGAKAICLILKNQPSNSNSHYGPYDGIMKPIPGLWIGKYDGIQLKKYAKLNFKATLNLTGSIKKGKMHNIWGVLPGQSEENIMITSHHDAPFKGAVEDGSGVAQVLAQAKLWAGVNQKKRKRNMVFVVDAGHFYGSLGAHSFARTHSDLMNKTRLLITLEHLGAKEVREENKHYIKTNKQAYTVMFTSPEPQVIATVINALKRKPTKITTSMAMNLLADAPTSDAAGYALESDVPLISWIGCPYYLLDEHDTLDKIDKKEIGRICETVTEMIKPYMARR